MKLISYGAAREVTGSKHMLIVGENKILFDCGMFHGHRDEADKKNQEFGFDPKELDAVVLSHAHIDHSGNLPLLVKQGYKGPIFCTSATEDLCKHMLMDSAYIQEREVEYLNEKKRRKGDDLVEPLYTQEDAETALGYFRSKKYNETFEPVEGVKVTYREAGHILGAAIVEIEATENGETKKIVFTGDLGRRDLPVLRDPYQPKYADILITESTYGNRLHEPVLEAEEKLAKIINTTIGKGGKLIIPAFALGRTQEIVYAIHKLMDDGEIRSDLPVFVDSPLAVNVTEVFRKHKECYDMETREAFTDNNKDPFGFDRLKYITKVEESKALNNHQGPCIIIAASGMCEFGRILHHLKNNIENHRNTVLVVGYMAEHTLGRKILEKQREVKIFRKIYNLNCEVEVIDAYSAHADRSDLLSFATHLDGLKQVFIVHGEEKAQMDFRAALEKNGIHNIQIPKHGEEFEL